MAVTQAPSPEFTHLPESAQREVAERLLAITDSGWRPFWCRRPDCDGLPHHAPGAFGETVYAGVSDPAGPRGEPLDEIWYERPTGEVFCPEHHKERPGPRDTPLGRPVLEPEWAHKHARADQRLPSWKRPWTLFVMSGRGTGKTRLGAEFVTLCARKGLNGAILGRRGTELVNTHVATIIAHAHPEFTPVHWASKDILEWPNGAITYLFSAEKPENIRSVNLSYAWVDEAAFMDDIETAWMNLTLATRIETPGNPIHTLVTSTPTSTPWVVKMEDDEDVEVRRVSTYANRANLSWSYLEALRKEYEGTRMGRQEIHGEVLRDVEGALWNDDLFDHLRLEATEFEEFLETLDTRVMGIDPAGSKGPRSDATGIIGVGVQNTDEDGAALAAAQFFVLGDATLKGTPTEWARAAFKAARMWAVHVIVVEKNFGGDMVKQVLGDFADKYPDEACDANGDPFRIEVVQAVKSKETRAEGTVGRYEQGRVTHVTCSNIYGDLSTLEKEQVGWVPKSRGGKSPSPNRIDALVWAMRKADVSRKFAATTADASKVREMMRAGRAGARQAG